METIENIKEYDISKHCQTRYAERIMGKDNNGDINHFVFTNQDKIKKDINKLINYGECIYSGKQSHKDGKGNVIDVYLNGCWIILVDEKYKTTVTLYKIDLGLDDEFNKAYISKMIEKLNANKEALEVTKQQIQVETNTYKELIEDAESQIKEYRTMIKNLEELCTGYKTIIENNSVKVSQANRDVAEVLNTLIGKREF